MRGALGNQTSYFGFGGSDLRKVCLPVPSSRVLQTPAYLFSSLSDLTAEYLGEDLTAAKWIMSR
jgi:hypothetical protein